MVRALKSISSMRKDGKMWRIRAKTNSTSRQDIQKNILLFSIIISDIAMASPGARLLIISCNESDPRIDPGRYFNTSSTQTTVVKTTGGRTADAVGSIYHTDAATRIGMIVVLQHTGCTSVSADVDGSVRTEVQSLRASPYVRRDIPIIGYVVDTPTGQLREVNVPRSGYDEEARRRVLSQMDDFGPFWS